MLSDFADVEQAIETGKNLDERSEIREAGDGAEIGLADFRCSAKIADNFQRLCRLLLIAGRDVDLAGVFDVDFDARFFDDAANHFAARPDEVANLVGRNLNGVEARGVRGNLLAARSQDFFHLAENMQAAGLRLVHGFTHDLRRDALDFDVHLHGRDAFARARDLEVHIAVVIFGASDVGEDGVSIAFLDEAHGNTCNGSFERDASIHQRNRSSANGRHRRGAIRFKNVGDDPHGVGPFFRIRKNRGNRALGESAVTDFTTACAAHEANFANRKRREIVVEEEAFLGFALEAFQALLVVGGAESGCDQGLGFAACEDGAAVGSRQDAGFDPDVANLVELAAVWTTSGYGNVFAEDFLQQEFVVVGELFQASFVVFCDGGLQFLLQFGNQLVAFGFGVLRGVEGVGQTGADVALEVVEIGFVEFDRSDFALLLPDSARQIADGGADFLDFGVGKLDGVEDGLFFDFLRAGFDHDDGVSGGDD